VPRERLAGADLRGPLRRHGHQGQRSPGGETHSGARGGTA
jgi:hypothetical protein